MASKMPRKKALETGKGDKLSDGAYVKVLELLFDGELPGGAIFSQRELVEMTGAPLGPLRDALRVLETEGLITIHARTGIEIVKPGLELIVSTYQFRGIIENAAVAVYAETAEERELVELERRHRAVISGLGTNGLSEELNAEVEELETLLHYAIVRSLSNPIIENSYKRIHSYLRLIRINRKVSISLIRPSLEEHLLIITSCQARDSKAAAMALQSHFRAALERTMGILS